MRRLVVVAFAGCLVACGSGSTGPAAPGPAPVQPTPTPTEGPLSGRWIGLTSEGMGLITTDRTRNDYCTNYYDWSGTLSHQGTRLTGTMTSRFAGADCVSGGRGYHIPADAFGDTPVTDSLTLAVTPTGGVSISWDDWVSTVGGAAGELNRDLAGTYTANTINLAGERAEGRSSWSVTFGLRRQ